MPKRHPSDNCPPTVSALLSSTALRSWGVAAPEPARGTLLRSDGTAVQAGELRNGGWVPIMYDTGGIWWTM